MTQEEFNQYTWNKKWPVELLQLPELMSRRKRSHDVNIFSINQERAFGVFLSDSLHGFCKNAYRNFLSFRVNMTIFDSTKKRTKIKMKNVL